MLGGALRGIGMIGRFVVYSFFEVFVALGFFTPALFLVTHARSQDVEDYQAVAVVSIAAAAGLTGGVVFGRLANLRLVETVRELMATIAVLKTVVLLGPLATSFLVLVGFRAPHSLAFGATVPIHMTVLGEVVCVA
ncbi:hypothetical protein AAFF_G00421750 [Aldrovandia affinis]|uniref:Uncharacterized protein n=1 Tax=Aldrovandia affinis TaxID=143900 RepID=A0AAD7SAB9_9TELE|nr:hypothetical protein AAFF_G00421750 [Aldrovandia affinis]